MSAGPQDKPERCPGIRQGIIRDDDEFRETVRTLGGYDVSDMGKILYEG
jgi:hypothetical protein